MQDVSTNLFSLIKYNYSISHPSSLIPQPSALSPISKMPEIAINGQFNIDFPFQSEGNIEIDRTSSALKTVPSNWSSFCDAVDAKLEPLAAAKATLKKVCTAFYLVIFVAVVGTQIIANTRFRESLPFRVDLFFFPFIFFPAILAYLCFWLRARGTITRSMDDVQKLCGEYSGNGVTYELLNKHWGGCNKVSSYVYVYANNSSR